MPAPSPMPPKSELEQAYVVEGLSLLALAGKYQTSPPTIKRWLIKFNIPVRTKEQQEEINRQKQRAKLEALSTPLVPHVEAELVDESEAKPSEQVGGRILALPQAASSIDSADDEVETAFDLLKPQHQKLAIAYVDSLLKRDGATQEQIAERVNSSVDTLERQLKEQTFMDAVQELFQPQFAFQGSLGLKQLILEKIQKGQIPKGEWKTFAEILGLVNGPSINLNIGNNLVIRDKRLKPF